MLLRKLLKWFLVLLVVLALAVLVVVWPVLGVNPLEGRVEKLWNVTSNEVDFFVRFPAARVLDEPVVRSLEADPLFAPVGELRRQLQNATERVAREVNPQIPLGLFEIDVREDLFGREMAVAGRIQGDYANPRLDNFLFMTRVAPWARFLSALKRGFVRDRIPGLDDRIQVVKGLYLRVELDDATTQALQAIRSIRGGRVHPMNVVFLARIGDVVLVSDSDLWIEHALAGGANVLPADPWFESDFLRRSLGGDAAEAYVRYNLTQSLLAHHGAPGAGRPLSFLTEIVPVPIVGDLTVQVEAKPGNRVDFMVDNHPPGDGFKAVRPEQRQYLQEIYDAEKVDLRFELGPEGIGRFIPRTRTVAAAVARAPNRALIQLAQGSMTPQAREDMDADIRALSKQQYRGFADLADKILQGVDDVHLVIVHRPSIYERTTFSTYRDPPGAEQVPDGQFSYTLISRLKDSTRAQEVVDRLKANLSSINLEYTGQHESGLFETAKLKVGTFAQSLIVPAFGAVEKDGRYVFVSTSVEGAEAVIKAAKFENERFVGREDVAAAIAHLPVEATLGVLTDGQLLREGLWSFVRDYATEKLRIPSALEEYVKDREAAGVDPTDDEIENFKQSYVVNNYADYREEWERGIAWLRNFGPIAFSLNLGQGADKHIVLQGTLQVSTPEP